jgi:hypothetical protein
MAIGLGDLAMSHNDAIEWPSKDTFYRIAESVRIPDCGSYSAVRSKTVGATWIGRRLNGRVVKDNVADD